jgi:hypothetical protein
MQEINILMEWLEFETIYKKKEWPQKKNLRHSSGTSFCIVSLGHFLALKGPTKRYCHQLN